MGMSEARQKMLIWRMAYVRFGLMAAAALMVASCGSQKKDAAEAPPDKSTEAPAPSRTSGVASAAAARTEPRPAAIASACLTQGGERLRVAPLRAVGTEPFWAARIDGRCVTYSHPEDPDGTR